MINNTGVDEVKNDKEISTISSNVSITQYLKKCFQYRDLLWALVRKDLKVRYAQTRLGLFLSMLQPIVGLILFAFFFGRLLHINSDGSPYPVFVFIGMMSWYYFSFVVAFTGVSLIESQYIIKKVYFPKLVIPVSKAISGLIEFFIWLVILVILLIIFRIAPSYRLLFFPLFLIMNILCGLTIGIWLCALSYHKRDILHVVPYMIGLTIMVTPVFYPNNIIPDYAYFLTYINPMAGVIQGFRWCITGVENFSFFYIPGFLLTILLFISSIWYFKKVEYRMAEKL